VTGAVITLSSALTSTIAGASTVLTARATFPTSLLASVPLARLHFSSAVTVSQLPAVTTWPKLDATWQQIGPNDVRAVTSSLLIPNTNYIVNVPVKISCATRCVAVKRLQHVVRVLGSELWLEQLLASQNYLPVSFRSSVGDARALQPGAGTFAWRFPQISSSLRSQWHAGNGGVVVRGALMRFQDAHHLASTGAVNGLTWAALLRAASSGQKNPAKYNYVVVSMTYPESLTLYVNGTATFHTNINTGIPQSPTAPGTYPVYLRYVTTTMSGTNPDGTKYHDTGIPWVSYFNGGDALHGFIRGSYGSEQSLGCVEMRFADAKVVWPFTPIGTLVTVR
jgi:hypothetical protein